MTIDIFLFFLSILVILTIFHLVQHDMRNDYIFSEKLTTFLHIFIPYMLIFVVLLLGFYLDLGKNFGGLGIIVAAIISKYLPNLSMLLSSSNCRKDFLRTYFQSHHEDIIYGYLLAVMFFAFSAKDKQFYVAILAYLLGLFINCKFSFLCIENILESFNKFLKFYKNHYKVPFYALAFYLFFISFPDFHSFLVDHLWAIIPPSIFTVLGISLYILKDKHKLNEKQP